MVNSSSILFEKEIQYYLPLKTKEMQIIGSWLFIEPLVKLINPLHPFQPEKARFLLLAIKEVRASLVNNYYEGIHKPSEPVGGEGIWVQNSTMDFQAGLGKDVHFLSFSNSKYC